MKSNQLITEISRIQEMMGLVKENKSLLKESLIDEIVEILVKFLRKDVSELTALGVRNADDVKSVMDDFLDPLVPAANKTNMLKLILEDVGDVAIKSLAKSAIDDVTTGVGKVVSDRSKTYIDWYKQGVMTYDDVLAKISEDLSDIMVKSSDELSSLKNAINDESLLKVRSQLDNAKAILDAETDAATKAAKQAKEQLDMAKKLSDQFDSVKTQIDALPSFKALSGDEQLAVRNFLESNKTKTPTVLISETETFISKILLDPARVKQIPLEDRKFLQRFKTLLQNPKKILLYAGSGTLLVIIGLLLTGNIGSARKLYNDNEKDWEENDPDNPTNDEETKTCDQDLDKFKAWLKGQGFGDTTIASATFDVKICSGTITLGDGSLGKLTWDGNTYIA